MNCSMTRLTSLITALACLALSSPAAGQSARHVVSYTPGTGAALDFETGLPMNVPSAALGEPSRFTPDDDFPSVVSVFSPPYKRSQLVSIGAGGQLTLRLSNYAIPQAGGPEIGVFTNAGVALDFGAFPNVQAGDPAEAFGDDFASVAISEDGIHWFDLGDKYFNMPTNGYTDLADPFSVVPGNATSDFQQPFTAAFGDFDGLDHSGLLALLNRSGGGTWLDISASGLAKVGFVRFSLADDAGWNFELDGVSIAHGAVGGAVPEPASGVLLLWLAVMGINCRRRPYAVAAELVRSQAKSIARWLELDSAHR